jgi:hypothetical protein
VILRPPLSSSCSSTPTFSRACIALRSTEPEASTWWHGREPRFLVLPCAFLRRPTPTVYALLVTEPVLVGMHNFVPCGGRHVGQQQHIGRTTSRGSVEAALSADIVSSSLSINFHVLGWYILRG